MIHGGLLEGEPVASFCMSETEVTVAAFSERMPDSIDSTRAYRKDKELGESEEERARYNSACNTNPARSQKVDTSRHPINCVSWSQARKYCELLGGDLPTANEWRLAARGPDPGRRYPWGDSPRPSCELANMFALGLTGSPTCGDGRTSEVGSRPRGATEDGLLDMSGNVSEWVVGEKGEPRSCGGHLENGGPFQKADWCRSPPSTLRMRRGEGVMIDYQRFALTGFRCVTRGEENTDASRDRIVIDEWSPSHRDAPRVAMFRSTEPLELELEDAAVSPYFTSPPIPVQARREFSVSAEVRASFGSDADNCVIDDLTEYEQLARVPSEPNTARRHDCMDRSEGEPWVECRYLDCGPSLEVLFHSSPCAEINGEETLIRVDGERSTSVSKLAGELDDWELHAWGPAPPPPSAKCLVIRVALETERPPIPRMARAWFRNVEAWWIGA